MIRLLLDFFFPHGKNNARQPAWGAITLVTYCGMFLFTFGHIMALHPMNDRGWAPCKEKVAIDGTIIPATDGMCQYTLKQLDQPATFALSFFGGAAWPLFWSWHLQAEKTR